MLKKIIAVGFVIFTLLLIISSAGCIDDKQTYKLGILPAVSPWEYIDENGEPAGVSVDILNLIAKEKNFNIEYVVVGAEWEEALLSGKIDGKTSLVKTPQREEIIAFASSPFEDTKFAAVSRDGSGITVDDVVSGKVSIAVQRNSAFNTWAKANFGDKYDEMVADGKISLENSVDYSILAVLSGKIDTAVAGDMSVSYMLMNYPTLDFVGYIGQTSGGSTGVRKDNTEFLNLINDGMEKVLNTQEYDDLINKYNVQSMKNKYVVGIDEDNAPWSYIDSNGEYTGYDVEQIQWIANYSGFNVIFKPYDWSNNINAIVVGNLDLWASSMTITPERMNFVAFSEPYYSSGIGVLVKSDSTLTESDFSDDDARIVTVYGTSYIPWLKSYLGKEKYNRKITDGSIILKENFGECCEMLYSGRADFFIEGSNQIKSETEKGSAKIVFSEDNIEEFGIATNNGNIIMQDLIDKGLSEFEKSGKKAELLKKYNL